MRGSSGEHKSVGILWWSAGILWWYSTLSLTSEGQYITPRNLRIEKSEKRIEYGSVALMAGAALSP